jgi:digeranylgeranylglycerophospholipid reductase
VFVGTKVPSGYGWAFPGPGGTIRVGVGVIQPDTDANPRKLLDAVIGNKKLLRRYGLDLSGTPEVHSGILPSIAYERKLVFGNVIRVGDSANFATPSLGEGIRQCIELGRIAGEALGKAVKTGRAEPLKAYERRARRQLERDYKWGFRVNTRLARFTPRQWNGAVRRMGMAGPGGAAALLRNEFSRRKIARMSWNIGRAWVKKRLGRRR